MEKIILASFLSTFRKELDDEREVVLNFCTPEGHVVETYSSPDDFWPYLCLPISRWAVLADGNVAVFIEGRYACEDCPFSKRGADHGSI